MALLSLKIPKEHHKVEVDTTKPGMIVLGGTKYPIDGEVVGFITDMLEELQDLREVVQIYEHDYIQIQGES